MKKDNEYFLFINLVLLFVNPFNLTSVVFLPLLLRQIVSQLWHKTRWLSLSRAQGRQRNGKARRRHVLLTLLVE